AYLDPQLFLPAPAQGAIGIEIRDDDARTAELIAPLNDAPTAEAVRAERAFLVRLEGSCRTPIAAYTTRVGESLRICGQVLSPDGSQVFDNTITGPAFAPEAVGAALADILAQQAGEEFMAH